MNQENFIINSQAKHPPNIGLLEGLPNSPKHGADYKTIKKSTINLDD